MQIMLLSDTKPDLEATAALDGGSLFCQSPNNCQFRETAVRGRWQAERMGETAGSWDLHHKIANEVPPAPERIGYAELQARVGAGQRGRVKRAVSTLVALDVLQWQGMRQGRAVAQGQRSLEMAMADGFTPMPDREIQTYPLLMGPLDAFITSWHKGRKDPIDANDDLGSDGVTPYCTSALRAGGALASAALTRPDITVVVDLTFPHLGSWREVHAVEVKPYWALTRGALFEAAAQAALRRCSFSWLLAWVPDPDSGHFRPNEVSLIKEAGRTITALETEATELGLGLLVARALSDDEVLEKKAEPRRQAMDPNAAEELFAALEKREVRSRESAPPD